MSLNYVVLAIDDEAGVLMILRRILERAGFDVLTATDPEEGYKVLKKNVVDVILLDVNMPIMNGFELLEKIKQNDKFKNLPVIMLTCKGELDDFEQGRSLGVEDYITKPFESRLLIQRINRAIIYTTRPDEFKKGPDND